MDRSFCSLFTMGKAMLLSSKTNRLYVFSTQVVSDFQILYEVLSKQRVLFQYVQHIFA